MSHIEYSIKKEKVLMVKYAGELTLEVIEELRKELERLLEEHKDKVWVFDLSEVNFMDSSGIGFLVHTNNKKKMSNGKFYLLSPSQAVIKTLSLVNLLNFFEIVESEEDLEAEICC